MFTDARSIAVDGSGKIYVGEYTGGRIQVFDGDGKFITQWTVDGKMPLRALAADRNGVVYVVQSGNITRYEGATGKPLGQLSYGEGWGFDDVKVAADGGLVAAWYKNRDDIVRFNADGQVVRTIRAAISSITDSSELDTRVTVDGLGNIYAIGSFNNAIFKFSPDGKFTTRFGSDGDQPGQFRAPSAIAVDGKGRVYVSDFKGVQVFDSNGRYLAVFDAGGLASGMVFNDKNELFVAARTQVVKLALNEP
jgi:tripartite motif-containing protein 71